MTSPKLRDPFKTKGIPFYKGKTVCVTGATGLIGSYVVKILAESGAQIRAVEGLSRGANEFTLLADELSECDLLNAHHAEDAVSGCSYVIGCAGITGGVNLPKLDPVSYVGPATAMVINTLQACVTENVKGFGFLSSTTVYAPDEKPVREADVNNGKTLYPLYRGIGESKRFLEKLCAYYHQTTGLEIGIVRPSGAYGRYDNFDEKTSHVLPGMIRRALRTKKERGKTFEVWGDGADWRDFIHAQDIARSLLLAVAKTPNATPYNSASGNAIKTSQLAQLVLEAVGLDAKLTFSTGKPSALRKRLVNVDLAQKELGFKAQISLKDGIKDTVAWLKRQT